MPTPRHSDAQRDFWNLMRRWRIRIEQAILLIDQPATSTGRRPNSALNSSQIGRVARLLEIDQHLATVYQDTGARIRHPAPGTEFGGGTPLDVMIRGGDAGIEYVLQHVRSLERGTR